MSTRLRIPTNYTGTISVITANGESDVQLVLRCQNDKGVCVIVSKDTIDVAVIAAAYLPPTTILVRQFGSLRTSLSVGALQRSMERFTRPVLDAC